MKPDAKAVADFCAAAQNNNVNGVKAYLSLYGSDAVDEPLTGNGSGTALLWAVFGGHAEIVSILLHHNADIHARNSVGMTPLRMSDIAIHKMKGTEGHQAISNMLNERSLHVPSEEESHEIRMIRKTTEDTLTKIAHAPKITLKPRR